MKKMSDLPKDIEEEILCRVPLTSLRRVRSTCKKWNIALSKDRSFAENHLARQAKESKVVMMVDYRVYLMGVGESGIKREAKLSGSDQIDVCQMFHCDGLLLCISKDNTKVVVWNPYLGQTRWIMQPTHNDHRLDMYRYSLGYDKSSNSHKILRFIKFNRPDFVEFKIYDFNSDSWRLLDASPDWKIECYHRDVSLKGNTYWFATDTIEFEESFLVCFDFTSETFGPRLPLPFEPFPEETVILSVAREEQIVVLFQPWDTFMLEIWISTKIEPNTVSWNTKVFLSVNLEKLIHPLGASFFIDQEKQVAMVFDMDFYIERHVPEPDRHVAYILSVDGSLKKVHLGESAHSFCYPLVCLYVPSLVQLNYSNL